MDAIFQSTLYTALRTDENDISSYIQSLTNLLAEYSWVYSFRNLEIFMYDVLEKIPSDWVQELMRISIEELCQLPFGYKKEEWPESLKTFVTNCTELGSYRFAAGKFQDTVTKDNSSSNLFKKMSEKKQFEVKIMANLIEQVCQVLKCKTVIDVGSGLGYLDQTLHTNFGLCCVGLDSVPKYTLAAKARLKSDVCNHSVLHKTLEVKSSETCLLDFKKVLEEAKELHCSCAARGAVISENQSSSAVMVSLHSCGDLTQDMMKLFPELDDIKALVCIGCCYHLVDLSNFPMSDTCKHSVNSTQAVYPLWHPSISGLRLAAYGTRSHPGTFPSSVRREKNMFYRALLQYYIEKENIIWKNPKRHIRQTDLESFRIYCTQMFKGHALKGDEKALSELNTLYEEKLHIFPRIKILLVLQMMLQPLWEAFVVLDRVMYFKERNMFVQVLEMWDDCVSPRNLALCAYKK